MVKISPEEEPRIHNPDRHPNNNRSTQPKPARRLDASKLSGAKKSPEGQVRLHAHPLAQSGNGVPLESSDDRSEARNSAANLSRNEQQLKQNGRNPRPSETRRMNTRDHSTEQRAAVRQGESSETVDPGGTANGPTRQQAGTPQQERTAENRQALRSTQPLISGTDSRDENTSAAVEDAPDSGPQRRTHHSGRYERGTRHTPRMKADRAHKYERVQSETCAPTLRTVAMTAAYDTRDTATAAAGTTPSRHPLPDARRPCQRPREQPAEQLRTKGRREPVRPYHRTCKRKTLCEHFYWSPRITVEYSSSHWHPVQPDLEHRGLDRSPSRRSDYARYCATSCNVQEVERRKDLASLADRQYSHRERHDRQQTCRSHRRDSPARNSLTCPSAVTGRTSVGTERDDSMIHDELNALKSPTRNGNPMPTHPNTSLFSRLRYQPLHIPWTQITTVTETTGPLSTRPPTPHLPRKQSRVQLTCGGTTLGTHSDCKTRDAGPARPRMK